MIQKKIDILFTKAGQYNKYQFSIVILFFFQFVCSQFFHNNFSNLISRPFINLNNTYIRIEPNICKQYFNESNKDEIILSKNQIPTTSIILDFQIYCDSFKTYLISVFYYLGIILGSFISYIFYDKLETKITLGIFIPNQIICLILFQLLNYKNLKNNYYFLYINLFFLGQSEYIIVNNLFFYICDIIHLSYIPMFITIIISGRPISYLLGILFFNVMNFNWKTDLLIIAGINFIIYIITITYMVKSPKNALRNKKYANFTKYLLKISKRNNKKLKKEDFDFLLPFMSGKEKLEYENIFLLLNPKDINNVDYIEISSIMDDDEYNDSIDSIKNNKNEKSIYSYLKESFSSNYNEFNKGETSLKDDYLLSDDNNKIDSIKTLFNKIKMKDYSPLDLLKFKIQVINFCVLSFLWASYNFIKYGLDSTIKKIPEYNNNIFWVLCTHLIGLISLHIVMIIYISYKRAFHKLLVTFQLITFIALMMALYLNKGRKKINRYILSLVIVQVCWNCLYLLLILISLLIYPIMLRSKGFGLNIAFGTIGKLVIMFLVDSKNENEYILYFLTFDFFVILFSFALPKKIGSFVIDLNEHEENKKEKNHKINNDNEQLVYSKRKLTY